MSTPKPDHHQQPVPDSILILATCLLLATVYLATPALTPRGLDEMNAFSVGRSLQGHASFDIDSLGWTGPISGKNAVTDVGVDGHSYTSEDMAASIVAAPFIKLGYLAGVSPIHTAHLSFVVITVLTAAMVFMVARTFGYTSGTAVLAMLAFGLGSQAWVYATSLMNNAITALGLTMAIWGVTRVHIERRWQVALLGGLGMSVAGVSTIAAWVMLPLMFAYLVPWEDLRARGLKAVAADCWPVVVAFGIGAAVGLAAGAAYNIARYGSPIETSLARRGNLDFQLAYLPVGVYGMLFSTAIGLMWFAPVCLLAPFGAVMSIRGGQARPTALLLGMITLFLLLYGSYFFWWGGTLWGPRYLLPVGSCFILLGLPVINGLIQRNGPLWHRLLAWAVLIFSVLTQLAVSLLDFMLVSGQTHRMMKLFTPPGTFAEQLTFFTNLNLLPYPQALRLAAGGNWLVLWAQGGQLDWPVMLGGIVLVGLAACGLWLTLRRPGSRLLRPALAAEGALCIAFAGVLLTRYPHSGVPYHMQPPNLPGIGEAAAYLRQQAAPGDGVITLLYQLESYTWQEYYDSSVPDIGLTVQQQLDDNARVKLEHLPDWQKRIWLVSNVTVGANPDNAVERSLAQSAFVGNEIWFENWRVVPYTLVKEDAPLTASAAQFGDQGITLKSYSYQPFLDSDRWINVRLQWQTSQPLATNYTVFIHLFDQNGKLVAQQDGQPVAGYAPVSTWSPGQVVDDRHALLLPPGLASDEYQLRIGLYDPATGERLILAQGGDALTLDTISLPPG